MNMKFKFLVFILISSCFFVSAQTSNKKQVALEKAVQQLVQLSQFISSMKADQAESIADSALFYETASYLTQLERIKELVDVRDTMSVLIKRLGAMDNAASIAETSTRVEIAYAIGEEIFFGQPLVDVLAKIETLDELPDLLSSSKDVKIMEESVDIMPDKMDTQLADTEDSGEGLSEIPNIYEAIGQPSVYREVMKIFMTIFENQQPLLTVEDLAKLTKMLRPYNLKMNLGNLLCKKI